jgi:hypothetical protein
MILKAKLPYTILGTVDQGIRMLSKLIALSILAITPSAIIEGPETPLKRANQFY